jgi:hypothetical protein
MLAATALISLRICQLMEHVRYQRRRGSCGKSSSRMHGDFQACSSVLRDSVPEQCEVLASLSSHLPRSQSISRIYSFTRQISHSSTFVGIAMYLTQAPKIMASMTPALDFQDCFASSIYANVIICIGSERLPAHRVNFVTASDCFIALLQSFIKVSRWRTLLAHGRTHCWMLGSQVFTITLIKDNSKALKILIDTFYDKLTNNTTAVLRNDTGPTGARTVTRCGGGWG